METTKRSSLLGGALILAVIGMTAIVLALSDNPSNDISRSHNKSADTSHQVVECETTGRFLAINIDSNKMNPAKTVGKACDTLTITNLDSKTRLIAFGHHDSHKEYDGVAEKILTQGQSLTVTLNEKGKYTIHDHYDDAVKGTFTVN